MNIEQQIESEGISLSHMIIRKLNVQNEEKILRATKDKECYIQW